MSPDLIELITFDGEISQVYLIGNMAPHPVCIVLDADVE